MVVCSWKTHGAACLCSFILVVLWFYIIGEFCLMSVVTLQFSTLMWSYEGLTGCFHQPAFLFKKNCEHFKTDVFCASFERGCFPVTLSSSSISFWILEESLKPLNPCGCSSAAMPAIPNPSLSTFPKTRRKATCPTEVLTF